MTDMALTKTRIHAGAYEGVLTAKNDQTPDIALTFLEAEVGELSLTQDPTLPQTWNIKCQFSADLLADGVQTFLIIDRPTGETLDSFTIITGEPLNDDIRAEVDLLRAELDMLKKAFRRHCLETL
ncbi:MAG: hypothetical protein ABJ327_23465 [Litoreibacter sp.]